MNRLKKILVTLLIALCAIAGIIGIVACSGGGNTTPPQQQQPGNDNDDNDDDNTGDAISDAYKQAYTQYAAVMGGEAKSLEDWYAEVSAKVTALGAGAPAEIKVFDELGDDEYYLWVSFSGEKLYLAPLAGGDFEQYGHYVITAKKGGAIQSGVYFDVYYFDAQEAKQVVQTPRTDTRGEIELYLKASVATTYYVSVAATSAADYGIPYGDDPVLVVGTTASAVNVELGTPMQYTVTVQEMNGVKVSGVKVTLRYAATTESPAMDIANATTDTNGVVTFTFTKKDAAYQLVVDNATVPATYERLTETVFVPDFEENSTTITVTQAKKYVDDVIASVHTDLAQADDHLKNDFNNISTTQPETSIVKDGDNDSYKFSGSEVVYFAFDVPDNRAFANGKTMREILEDDEYYFSYEELTDEQTNTWTRHVYTDMLLSYCAKINSRGYYPLNEELYNFAHTAAEHNWFKPSSSVATAMAGKEWMLPLVVLNNTEKLAVGEENSYTANIGAATKSGNTYTPYGIGVPGTNLSVSNSVKPGYYTLTANVPDGVINFETYNNGTTANSSAGITTSNKFDHVFYGYTGDTGGVKRSFSLFREGETNKLSGMIYYTGSGNIWVYHQIISPNWTNKSGSSTPIEFTLTPCDYTAPAKINVKGSGKLTVIPVSWLDRTWTTSEDEKAVFGAGSVSSSTYALGNVPTYMTEFDDGRRAYCTYTLSFTMPDSIPGGKDSFMISGVKVDCSNVAYYGDGTIKAPATISAENLTYETAEFTTRTNALNGIIAYYDGDVPFEVDYTVTGTFSKYQVEYHPGEGATGDVYYDRRSGNYYDTSSATRSRATVKTLEDAGFTNPGKQFAYWECNEGGVVTRYKPGDIIEPVDHDIILTAVWRSTTENVAADKLAAGEDGKVTVEIDSALYTGTVVEFASSVTAGLYKLTINLGKNSIEGFFLVVGDYTVYFSHVLNSAEDNIYVGYILVEDGVTSLSFPTNNPEYGTATAVILLEQYVQPTLAADGGEVEFAVNPKDTADENLFKVKLAEGLVDGSYKITVTNNYTNASTVSITIAADNATATQQSGVYLINLIEEDEYIWVKAYATGNNYTAVTLAMERCYTVSFDKGDMAVTGGTSNDLKAKTGCATGDEITLPANPATGGFVYRDHVFRGWKLQGDTGGTIYKAGDTFTVGESDAVFEAYWVVEVFATEQFSGFGLSWNGSEKTANMSITKDTTTIQIKYDISGQPKIMITLDLGKYTVDGPIVANDLSGRSANDVYNVAFTYSEALSYGAGEDRHNIYVTYVSPKDGFSLSDRTLTIDGAIFDPILETLEDGGSLEIPGSLVGYKDAEHILKADGTKINVGAVATGYVSSYYTEVIRHFGFSLDESVLRGAEYNMHIMSYNIYKPTLYSVPTIGEEVVQGNEVIRRIKIATGATTMFFTLSSRTYCGYDIWLEPIADSEALKLDVEKDYTVNATDGVKVNLDVSQFKGGEDYGITVTVKGGVTPTLTLTGLSKPTTATLSQENGYHFKPVRFANNSFTITTDGGSDVEITIKIGSYAVGSLNSSAEGTTFTIPAGGTAELLPEGLVTGANYYFRLWVTGASNSNVIVVKELNTEPEKQWTLEQSNGFTELVLQLTDGKYYQFSCQDGSEVTITVHVMAYTTVNTYSVTSRPDEYEFDEFGEETPFVYGSTNYLNGANRNKFTVYVQDANAADATITMHYNGDQQVQLTKGDSADGYTAFYANIALTEQYFYFTCSDGLKDKWGKLTVIPTYDVALSVFEGAEYNHVTLTAEQDVYYVWRHSQFVSTDGFQLEIIAKPTSDDYDMSSVTFTLSYGASSGDGHYYSPVVFTSPTKEADGYHYFAFFHGESGVSDTTPTYFTLTVDVNQTVAVNIKVRKVVNVQTYTDNAPRFNSMDFNEIVLKLPDGFDLSKQYNVSITSWETVHASDDLKLTIVKGAEEQTVFTYGATETAAVKFTANLVFIRFEGCHYSAGGHTLKIRIENIIDKLNVDSQITATMPTSTAAVKVELDDGVDISKVYTLEITIPSTLSRDIYFVQGGTVSDYMSALYTGYLVGESVDGGKKYSFPVKFEEGNKNFTLQWSSSVSDEKAADCKVDLKLTEYTGDTLKADETGIDITFVKAKHFIGGKYTRFCPIVIDSSVDLTDKTLTIGTSTSDGSKFTDTVYLRMYSPYKSLKVGTASTEAGAVSVAKTNSVNNITVDTKADTTKKSRVYYLALKSSYNISYSASEITFHLTLTVA